MKVTIGKKKGSQTTLRCMELIELVEMIRTARYAEEVTRLRRDYIILSKIRMMKRNGEQISRPLDVEAIPSVCFSAEYRNHKGAMEMMAANTMFLVEVNNLVGYQEAEYLRDLAAQLPHTMLAFMGASGRSVKIVCRARSQKPSAEMTPDEIQTLLRSAYAIASKYFATQFETNIDIRIPSLGGGCKISADPHIYFNPNAEEFFVTEQPHKTPIHQKRQLTKDDQRLLPGYDLLQTQRFQFEDYLNQAFEANLNKPHDQAIDDALHLLARYCHDDGLPKEMCIYRTIREPDLGRDPKYVRMIFNNAYKKDILNNMPFRHITPEILLTLKTQAFMESRYEMRRNVLTGVVEYRPRDGREQPFCSLTQYVINSMTQDALMEGLKSWDKDVRRYIDSDKIEDFDPINDYLDLLPKWDGEDRIEALAARIPTDNADWTKNFHVWMLSMVAHWMGKDLLHGNAYTPLLIGPQGCGKSSFCRRLLPSKLDSYYYDRIDFKNEQSADLALTRFALINIDEFDQLSARRQAILKYLLQKSEVKTRRPYGMAIEELRRYASFIATTNNASPLSDPTGSRRFICILVQGAIDFRSPIDHEQLYAQAVCEINQGARYWFDDAETAVIMKQNEAFQIEDGLKTMIASFFIVTNDKKNGKWLPLSDIMSTLRSRYRNLRDDVGMMQQLGRQMTAIGFTQRRSTHGMTLYLVKTSGSSV
jgi:hypothetical protein